MSLIGASEQSATGVWRWLDPRSASQRNRGDRAAAQHDHPGGGPAHEGARRREGGVPELPCTGQDTEHSTTVATTAVRAQTPR